MIRSQFFLFLLFVSSFAVQLVAAEVRQKPAYFYVTTLADGATFMMRLEDPKLIREAREILSGKQTRDVHVSGMVVKAPAGYNGVWSFHLDPDSVDFFSLAAEVCDAATVMVEKDLEKVGGSFLPGARWCPWSSRIVGELRSLPEPIVTVVSTASQSEVAISPSSLASILGEDLTDTTESAQGDELPTKLAGVEVEFRRAGSSQRRKAPLLLASPEQINFTVPADTAGRYASLIRDDERDLEAATRVETVAPGVFFAETTEGRYAAATLLRVGSDGSRSEESLLSVDAEGNYVPVAVDFGSAQDRLYLSLYGSGIGSSKVSVRVGSQDAPVLYSGPQGMLEGLDQINIELPRSLASRSGADITVSAKNDDGQTLQSAPVKVMFKRQ